MRKEKDPVNESRKKSDLDIAAKFLNDWGVDSSDSLEILEEKGFSVSLGLHQHALREVIVSTPKRDFVGYTLTLEARIGPHNSKHIDATFSVDGFGSDKHALDSKLSSVKSMSVSRNISENGEKLNQIVLLSGIYKLRMGIPIK